jgi:hypothetical protein
MAIADLERRRAFGPDQTLAFPCGERHRPALGRLRLHMPIIHRTRAEARSRSCPPCPARLSPEPLANKAARCFSALGLAILRDRCRVPVETCNGHRAGITVAASPMAAFVRSGSPMAEVGDDETVTLLFARNDRPGRPSIGRLCLRTAPRIATMLLVAGSAASWPYSSESPPSFRDERAAHSSLFGQSGAISRETASMTASLFVVRSGAVVALNSGFRVAQALAIDWTRTRIAVASHRSVNLPLL